MALSEFQRYMIYDTSLQLLQQDMLTNSLFAGSRVGASLRDLVLQRQPVQPLTNPYDEAITGTLRADAAAVRQNARNVGEAAALTGVATTAVTQISDALTEMQSIITKLNDGDLTYSTQIRDQYNALRDKVTSIVTNTDYNGIFMLDSSKWGTEQIDSSGKVYIQAFTNGGFDLGFHSMDNMAWSDLDGSALSTANGRSAQATKLTDLQGTTSAIQDMYSGRQSGLESQQTQLETQADFLDQAVKARRQSTAPTTSLEQSLLNLFLGDSGTILDESS